VLLATVDKDRLYKEFRKPNLEIRILVFFDVLIYSADVPNIDYFIQYYMPRDKHINMI